MSISAILLGAGVVVWAKVAEPMEQTYWSQIEDIWFLDRECRSDHALPRVCLYRHLSKCRIVTIDPPSKLPRQTVIDLYRMCQGYFPEPVLLQREFSNPNYLPNQAPPMVDPAWVYQNKQGDK